MGIVNVKPTAMSEAVRACNKAEMMIASVCAEATKSEIQAIRRAGTGDATTFMHAARMSARMPELFASALRSGNLTAKHLDVIYLFISKYLSELEDRTQEEFDEWTESVVLRYLGHTPAPTTQELRSFLNGMFMAIEPEAFRAREEKEQKDIHLHRDQEKWRLKMSPADSQRLMEKIDKEAKPRAKETGEDLSEARMKVALDLLEGKKSNTMVHVHIYRTEGGGGWIPGVGAISAEEADRYQAFADTVDYLDEPDTVERYRPSEAQRNWVIGRDRTCRFPGCDRPASQTDIDHIQEYNHESPGEGGETDIANLQSLCRHHHNLKTNRVWRASTTDGIEVVWQGPQEQEFTTVPD